jgi:hypothetical protein
MSGIDWLNRLAKWRAVLTGWQLGTRQKGDPEADAVRDHREATLLLQAEMNALCTLLIARGLFTAEEWTAQLHREAEIRCKLLEQQFPGFTAVDNGMELDVRMTETVKGWKP